MRGNDVFGIVFSNTNDEALSEMTNLRTMGSIPFGGRYRLTDFPLSSMVNASISKVGIITKSNYQSLMDHVGTGKPWDLSRKNDGLFLLPPFNLGNQGVYSSRFEALNGAMNFINQCTEKYVILADSDLVANVDYTKLLEFHKSRNADITFVSAQCAPPQNGLLQLSFEADEDGKITKAEMISDEQARKLTHCAVSLYVMERYMLIRLINEGIAKEETLLKKVAIADKYNKLRVYTYKHEGFCHHIDSLENYFDTNMKLLSYSNRKDLFNAERPVYTKSKDSMPTRYGLENTAKNLLAADGCDIEGDVENCIIFRNVTVSKGAKVKNCIIMHNTFIGENAELENAILDKDVVIKPNQRLIGADSYPIYIGKKTII